MPNQTLYENRYDGEYLVSEANAHISRENGVINNATGAAVVLQAGLVLSQNHLGVPAVAAKQGNTGNGTITIDLTTPTLAHAVVGAYTVRFIDANDYTVLDPNGNELGNAALGQAFADQLKFTAAAGGTAFVAGDQFTITVPEGADDYTPYTGALPAVAILYNLTSINAGGSKKIAVTAREAEVNASEIQWDAGVTASPNVAVLQSQAIRQLGLKNILFR